MKIAGESAVLTDAAKLLEADRPHIVTADRPCALADFAKVRIDAINALVLEHGAVLLRGFEVRQSSDFQAFIDALKTSPMDYTYKSTPRTRVDRDIFTATEYPRQLQIPLHCENAYQRSWPMWIALCCLTPARAGGQTPIANMRKVTTSIDQTIVNRFARRGVKYIRHYRPYVDLQWKDVFQVETRDELARFCGDNDIEHKWLDGDTLRTTQVCQGVARHPLIGEMVFFNQAHLFHASSLDEKAYSDMVSFFGRDRLPRDARHGDGSDIDPEDLTRIREAFNAAAVDVEWQQGDVVILDNMQFAHGRRAFTGERKVLASLLNPHSPSFPIGMG